MTLLSGYTLVDWLDNCLKPDFFKRTSDGGQVVGGWQAIISNEPGDVYLPSHHVFSTG